MTGRDLKEWLAKLSDEDLDCEVYGGAPREDGTYDALEKMSLCKMDDGDKAIFLEPLPVDEDEDDEPAETEDAPEEKPEYPTED